MLDEHDELRHAIMSGDYRQALALIDELDEMSRDDKINKIGSYMRVLLVHLIKQAAEKRSTRSWDASINTALRQIVRSNKRRKAGGYYLDRNDLAEALTEVWPDALEWAAIETGEGVYSVDELNDVVGKHAILADALERIQGSLS